MTAQIRGLASLVCIVFCAAEAGGVAQFQGLGFLPGTTSYGQPFDMSSDGSIVVGATGIFPNAKAFTWDSANGMRGLGLLAGSITNAATGVSADGSIVAGTSGSDSGSEPFIWNATNGMQGLGQLPGRNKTFTKGLSNDGSIIAGTAYYEDPQTHRTRDFEAFVWDAANGFRGLATFQVEPSRAAPTQSPATARP